MGNLYSNLAEVYEMMYRTFINYDGEFVFYSGKMKEHHCSSVAELGCGTGNLAEKFISAGYKYTGIDLSKPMLEIAAAKFPAGKFIEADMRNFELTEKQDGCFFAGRTSAHLVSDDDMLQALKSINKNLVPGGVVCFDCIDAKKFIPLINEGKQIVHTASYEGRRFHRASYWTVNENQPGAFN
jgi:SAM-dependent methyltransferase